MEQLLLPWFSGEALEETIERTLTPQPLTIKHIANTMFMSQQTWTDFLAHQYYNENQLVFSFMNPPKLYLDIPKNPIRKVLKAMTGKRPPKFVKGYNFNNLTDMQRDELQGWAVNNVRSFWLTGIGLIEAAEKQVKEAVDNGNIPPEKRT
jgi:hypothetical protein